MNKDGGIRRVARRLRVSKLLIGPDLVQQGGSDSYWSVQETQEIVPVKGDKPEGSCPSGKQLALY